MIGNAYSVWDLNLNLITMFDDQFLVVYPDFVILVFDFLLLLYRLDYPGVGPEHSFLKDVERAEYYSITDEEALEGRLPYDNCFVKCTVICLAVLVIQQE
jgi:hypothetical protein